jgi:hypothetical protein
LWRERQTERRKRGKSERKGAVLSEKGKGIGWNIGEKQRDEKERRLMEG